MRQRRISDGKSFSPEVLHVVREAFDDAWGRIAHKFPPDEFICARDALADAAMNVARQDSSDVAMIRDAVLRVMAQRYPDHFADGKGGQDTKIG